MEIVTKGSIWFEQAPYIGGEIAVKKLHPLIGLNDEPFDNEFRTLSQIHHQNVVQLIGYCHESQVNFVKQGNETIKAKVMERILCFEYMQGGSLDKHIKGSLIIYLILLLLGYLIRFIYIFN